VKRFLNKTAFLVTSLFLLAAAYEAALERVERSSTQSSFTVYNEEGGIILAYQGDLAACKAISKPAPASTPTVFHRG
jgi:hypothetical protein